MKLPMAPSRSSGWLLDEGGAGCYIRLGDVQSLYEASLASGLPTSGIPRIAMLEDKPWGLREFAIVDMDGNLVRIGQVIAQKAI